MVRSKICPFGVGGFCFFFQAEDGIRDVAVTGVQTCALPISSLAASSMLGLANSSVMVVMPILRAIFSILALHRRRWKPAGTARMASLASLVQVIGTSS